MKFPVKIFSLFNMSVIIICSRCSPCGQLTDCVYVRFHTSQAVVGNEVPLVRIAGVVVVKSVTVKSLIHKVISCALILIVVVLLTHT